MTNEEKAKEIAEFQKCPYYVHSDGDPEIEYSITECYDSALAMAEWKDKQFNETLKRANKSIIKAHEEGAKIERERIIEKACEWLNDWLTDDICRCGLPISKIAREDFFNNFKQSMMEE